MFSRVGFIRASFLSIQANSPRVNRISLTSSTTLFRIRSFCTSTINNDGDVTYSFFINL